MLGVREFRDEAGIYRRVPAPVGSDGAPAPPVKPKRRPITIAPVRASAPLGIKYRAKLDALIGEMQRSLTYWLTAKYRANPPAIATDALPATELRRLMRRLSRQWQRRFDEAAPELAAYFAQAAADRTDAALRFILRKAGMSVAFKLTSAQADAYQAIVGENVSLIRSIAQEHLSEVEGLVMRSVQAGHDLGELAARLEHRYTVTKRRAALIARDQNNKATAVITRVRQQELGITKARWIHSAGGRTPRPSHVKASREGVIYDVAEGWFDPEVGDYIWPGTLINCRCTSRSVLPTVSA